ncbi:MAG: rhomboid family intramembrane serine protease [Phycisphaerae bacterium]|nr:rhomboid family intramembrane serine protease [Phycisphaerae bacterium]
MEDAHDATDSKPPEANGAGPCRVGRALTDAIDGLALGADVPRTVLDMTARTQKRLVYGGYSYIAGDEHRWPGGAVQLAKGNSTILLTPWLGPERADGLAHAWELFGRTFRANTGLMLLGAAPVDSPEVEAFFDATEGVTAYIDAESKTFRLRRKSSLVTAELMPFTEKNLERLCGKAHRKSQAVDCPARMVRDVAELQKTATFMARSRRMMGKPICAYAIAAVCVAVFIAMLITTKFQSLHNPSIEDLRSWGANHGPLVRAGQWWRIITCGFVHIGIVHLAFNVYVLVLLGRYLEIFQGRWRPVAYFLFSVVTASLASLWWNPLVTSAGASGGVFGQAGALLAIVVLHRQDFPPHLQKGLQKMVVTFLIYNAIFFVMLRDVIDGAAHIGGFVGGFAIAMVLSRSPVRAVWPALRAWVALGALAIGVAAFAQYTVDRIPSEQGQTGSIVPPAGVEWARVVSDTLEQWNKSDADAVSAAVTWYENGSAQQSVRDDALEGIAGCVGLLEVKRTYPAPTGTAAPVDELVLDYDRLRQYRIAYCRAMAENLRGPDKKVDLADMEKKISAARQDFDKNSAQLRSQLEDNP